MFWHCVVQMRAEMEAQMRAELAQRQGIAGISEEQMTKLKEEAAEKARAEVGLQGKDGTTMGKCLWRLRCQSQQLGCELLDRQIAYVSLAWRSMYVFVWCV